MSYSLNQKSFRDKVFGCWFGKSIGGTLGAPYEWSTEMNHVTFYPAEINGTSIPNDDLDLQLVWLAAAERFGALNLNERILGEYWNEFITGPWNEYGVCRNNMRLGLTPPLTGSCNNETWKWSNGAWIRSEIWACIFPGKPTWAARAAYRDSCCDHVGEGIYAEIFTASLESAAFVESNLETIIAVALSLIPADCRIARAVKLAMECYHKGRSLEEARNAVLEDSADLGQFQAPANVGYTVLGLLYGEGDFGKSVCYAVNCGDDTDCTGGTAGAVMGIILGASGIPEKWKTPIGEEIKTCSIENTGRKHVLPIPKDLTELTNRVIFCAEEASAANPELMRFTAGEANLPPSAKPAQFEMDEHKWFLAGKRPFELTYELPFGVVSFEFENGPYVEAGKPLKVTLRGRMAYSELEVLSVTIQCPESWSAGSALFQPEFDQAEITIVPGETITNAVTYITAEIRRHDRMLPYLVAIPLFRKEAVALYGKEVNQTRPAEFFDAHFRSVSRTKAYKAWQTEEKKR